MLSTQRVHFGCHRQGAMRGVCLRRLVLKVSLKINVCFISQNASNYLKSVKVDVLDITSKVYNIRDGNQGNNITVRNEFTQYDNESKACCNYEFYVLNSNCKSLVSSYQRTKSPYWPYKILIA